MKPIDTLTAPRFESLVAEAVALPSAPEGFVRRAIEAWPSEPGRIGAWLRRAVAVVAFDSWAASPLAFGVRASGSDVRQLLFRALDRDIDLRVAPQDAHHTLSGQVLGPGGAGVAELSGPHGGAEDPAPTQTVPLDDFGEFCFAHVGPGRHVLTLRVDRDEIVLPPIDVGAPPR